MDQITKARAVMRKVAHKEGYSLSTTGRGDWSVRSKSNRAWRGIIVVIPSEFPKGALFPVCTRHNRYEELEELRGKMCEALMAEGVLEAA